MSSRKSAALDMSAFNKTAKIQNPVSEVNEKDGEEFDCLWNLLNFLY